MPILKHAKKKIRVDQRRATRNKQTKTRVKSAVKALRANPTDSSLLVKVFSVVDRAAKTHVLHVRTANRIKSRLSKFATKSASVKA